MMPGGCDIGLQARSSRNPTCTAMRPAVNRLRRAWPRSIGGAGPAARRRRPPAPPTLRRPWPRSSGTFGKRRGRRRHPRPLQRPDRLEPLGRFSSLARTSNITKGRRGRGRRCRHPWSPITKHHPGIVGKTSSRSSSATVEPWGRADVAGLRVPAGHGFAHPAQHLHRPGPYAESRHRRHCDHTPDGRPLRQLPPLRPVRASHYNRLHPRPAVLLRLRATTARRDEHLGRQGILLARQLPRRRCQEHPLTSLGG